MTFRKKRGPAPKPCPRCSKTTCLHCACVHCQETGSLCEAKVPAASRERRRMCRRCSEVSMKSRRQLQAAGVQPMPLLSSSLGQGHHHLQFSPPPVASPAPLPPYLLRPVPEHCGLGCGLQVSGYALVDTRSPASHPLRAAAQQAVEPFVPYSSPAIPRSHTPTSQFPPPPVASPAPPPPYLLGPVPEVSGYALVDTRSPASYPLRAAAQQPVKTFAPYSSPAIPSYNTPISSPWSAVGHFSSLGQQEAWGAGGPSLLDGEKTQASKARKPDDYRLAEDAYRVMDESLFQHGGLGVVGLGVSGVKKSEGTAILVTARYKAGLDGPCLAIDAAHFDTQESVTAAHAWVVLNRAKVYQRLGCEPPSAAEWEAFRKGEILVEVTPSNITSGPSCGVAYTLAFVALLTGVRPRTDTAMTGAMSFSGDVLYVGGLEGKTRGTQRAGIHRLLLPQPCLTDEVRSLATALQIAPIAIRTAWDAIGAIFPVPPMVPGALQLDGRYATGLYGNAHGLQIMGSNEGGWWLAVQTVECIVLPGRGRVSVLGMKDHGKMYELWTGRASQAVEFFCLDGQLERLARRRLWPGGSLQECDVLFRSLVGSLGTRQLMLAVHLALAHALEGSTSEFRVVALGEVVGLHGDIARDGRLMGNGIGAKDVGELRKIRFKTFPSLRSMVVPLKTRDALLAAMKKKGRSTLKDFSKDQVLTPDTLKVVGATDFWEALAAARRGLQPDADMELCPPSQPRSYLPTWGRRLLGGT